MKPENAQNILLMRFGLPFNNEISFFFTFLSRVVSRLKIDYSE